jgi:hypothetical protein
LVSPTLPDFSVLVRPRSLNSSGLGNKEILDAPLRRGTLREQPLEHAPWDPDHAFVLADDDAELHGLPVRIPAGAA